MSLVVGEDRILCPWRFDYVMLVSRHLYSDERSILFDENVKVPEKVCDRKYYILGYGDHGGDVGTVLAQYFGLKISSKTTYLLGSIVTNNSLMMTIDDFVLRGLDPTRGFEICAGLSPEVILEYIQLPQPWTSNLVFNQTPPKEEGVLMSYRKLDFNFEMSEEQGGINFLDPNVRMCGERSGRLKFAYQDGRIFISREGLDEGGYWYCFDVLDAKGEPRHVQYTFYQQRGAPQPPKYHNGILFSFCSDLRDYNPIAVDVLKNEPTNEVPWIKKVVFNERFSFIGHGKSRVRDEYNGVYVNEEKNA